MRIRGILIAVTVAGELGACASAAAQLRASIPPDPPLGVPMSFTAKTTFGPMAGNGAIVANAPTGNALLTLFPSQPPYTHCTLHNFYESALFVQRTFPVFDGDTEIRVTITNIRIEADGPIHSEIGPNGELTFVNAPLILTGTIELYEDFLLTLDLTESFSTEVGSFTATVTQGNGFVSFAVDDIPILIANIASNDLPFDVLSLTYGVTLGRVQFGGPAMLVYGDADADGDVDLLDYGRFDACHAGDGAEIDIYCSLFDFDTDSDVDLIDWSAFQAAFRPE